MMDISANYKLCRHGRRSSELKSVHSRIKWENPDQLQNRRTTAQDYGFAVDYYDYLALHTSKLQSEVMLAMHQFSSFLSDIQNIL